MTDINDPRSIDYARQLVTSGIHVAATLNEEIFKLPKMRAWPNATFMVGLVCASAGYARAEELSKEDFLLLCGVAHDLIRGEVVSSTLKE